MKQDEKTVRKLLSACASGNKQAVEAILSSGVDINIQDRDGRTPFFASSDKGSLKVADFLVSRGADIRIIDNSGMTPLMTASHSGHRKIVEFILSKDFGNIDETNNIGDTALMLACQTGRSEIVELLIASGADVNHTRDSGVTCLMFASQSGHVDAVRLLIAKGADVNAVDSANDTASSLASKNRHYNIAEFLAEGGAELPDKNETPCKVKEEDVLDYLIGMITEMWNITEGTSEYSDEEFAAYCTSLDIYEFDVDPYEREEFFHRIVDEFGLHGERENVLSEFRMTRKLTLLPVRDIVTKYVFSR